MAGLIAGRMMRSLDPQIIESQPALPNNHSAVLRFRSSVVGDVLGIPFRKVQMIKGALPWKNPVADALAYSFKNTGVRRSDRSITSGLVVDERFIAPPDFILQLAARQDIKFGSPLSFTTDAGNRAIPIVSTMPMPALMELLDYPLRDAIKFESVPGINIKARLGATDAYVSLLTPDPTLPFSRLSITGDELVIECLNVTPDKISSGSVFAQACALLGIGVIWREGDLDVRAARYSKILPIEEGKRRAFLHWATDHHNVFSLGRFATWRPNLLLDDLVKDVRLIERWINEGDRYAISKHR